MPEEEKIVSEEKACLFCGQTENDEITYGKFFHTETISIHQNCMFFASGLHQNGEDETEGLLGFLIPDLQRESNRGKKLTCYYCKAQGATVGCCKGSCKRTFHFPCGVRNNSLHQYFDTFASFCQDHKPKQKTKKCSPASEFFCKICLSSLVRSNSDSYIYSPCCTNNWFHRDCMQKYAFSAGSHFFKCPTCNNNTSFIKEMQMQGIWILDKDASWELEENAYEELLRHPECGAENCLCKKGRKYYGKGKSGWALLRCLVCGSKARHKHCENLRPAATFWKCPECKTIEVEICKKKELELKAIATNGPEQPSSSASGSYASSIDGKLVAEILSGKRQLAVTLVKFTSLEDVLKKNNLTLRGSLELRKRKACADSNVDAKRICPSPPQENAQSPPEEKSLYEMLKRKPLKDKNLREFTKKPVKVRRVKPCCSDGRNQCIRKLFGFECSHVTNKLC